MKNIKLKMRKCSKCKIVKSMDNFYNEDFYYCKPCWRNYINSRKIKKERKWQITLRTGKKTCIGCNKTKPTSEFFKHIRSKDGFGSHCKDCQNLASKEYLRLHPKKHKKYVDAWLEKHPGWYNAYQVKRRKANPIKAKNKDLFYTHGITLEVYNSLLIKQDNKCAICERSAKSFKRDLAVDHDHKKKIIRGLLCDRCNLGLGYFVDSISMLKRAIKYLNKKRNNKNAPAHRK